MFDKLNRFLNSLKPDHFISPFPHENNLRVKKQFGNSVAILKITRLLTFWIAVDDVVSDVSGQVIFQGFFFRSVSGTR